MSEQTYFPSKVSPPTDPETARLIECAIRKATYVSDEPTRRAAINDDIHLANIQLLLHRYPTLLASAQQTACWSIMNIFRQLSSADAQEKVFLRIKAVLW